MHLAPAVTRIARRTLDVLLVVLIGSVLAMLVLARGLPLITGGSTFVVGGGSMEPTIPLGSVVHATPVHAADLRVGDVVSLQTGAHHAVFTHRIIRIATLPDGLYLETKGDGNPTADPALVPATAVIGRVQLWVPYVGYGVALVSSFQGVLFLLSIAAVLLALAWLLETLEDDQREALRRRAREAVATLTPDAPGGTELTA